jgi:predicted dithiol-disulfide oxidoreductase (DUF899 family)
LYSGAQSRRPVVYHTYSTYARGLDGLWGMYPWLDRAPRGRNGIQRQISTIRNLFGFDHYRYRLVDF